MNSVALIQNPPKYERPQRFLYRWQLEALTEWLRCGRRGIVEAVTGSGKTDMAFAAIEDAVQREMFVLVVVPTRVLIEQWTNRLKSSFGDLKIGRLGDNYRDQPKDFDIIVATRHSAASQKPLPPEGKNGLLIADECHGFGGGVLRRALIGAYSERLGLTATLERSDDAIDKVIVPYFGGVCYHYGFAEAIQDGVCAQPRVAFVSVPLDESERADYASVEQQLVDARRVLRKIPKMPLDFADFLASVTYLSEQDVGPNGKAARDYLDALGKRREIVANSTSKFRALSTIAPTIEQAQGALVFTETVRAANHAVNRLDTELRIEPITGETPKRDRSRILEGLRSGELDAVAAPRVLDEGVDVPNANLGVVISASRTRRQMIQRMGRVLRKKPKGSGARFVILFSTDTMEDPRTTDDRDGFIDEIEAISDATRVFDLQELPQVAPFLDWDGPNEVPEPDQMTSQRVLQTESDRWDVAFSDEDDLLVAKGLAADIGIESMYARLNYLQWEQPTWLHGWVRSQIPELSAEELGEADESQYLDREQIELPKLSKAKPKKKRLSTGESPVVVVQVGKEFALRCAGCETLSPTTKFRWQVMDQTVECSCRDW